MNGFDNRRSAGDRIIRENDRRGEVHVAVKTGPLLASMPRTLYRYAVFAEAASGRVSAAVVPTVVNVVPFALRATS